MEKARLRNGYREMVPGDTAQENRHSAGFRLMPRDLLPAALTLGLSVLAAWGLRPLRAEEPEEPSDPPAAAQPDAEKRKSAPDEFPTGSLLRLSIEIPEEGLESLRSDHRVYVKGTLKDGDTAYPDVGIRLKGSAGSFQPLEEKPGFTVKVNHFAPLKRFRGQRKFILNNAAQDPTYLSETLGNDLFRAAGIPAPRTAFARVSLNGRDLGLYVLLEAATRDFLAAAFGDPTGNLYEGPGEVTEELDADTRGGASDRSDLSALAKAAEEGDLPSRLEKLGEVLDVQKFCTFLAVEVLTWHWDGYGMAANNYHLYRIPSSGRFVFFPHGTDQLFGEPEAFIEPEWNGLVARALLETPEGKERFRERLAELRRTLLETPRIEERLKELLPVLRPAVAELGEEATRGHEEAVQDLVRRIRNRSRSVDDQLAGRAPPRRAEPPKGDPLEFGEDRVARLSGWDTRSVEGEPSLETVGGGEEKAALKISLDPSRGGVASFRVRVSLEKGRYVFKGKLRIEGVDPFEEESEFPAGACLRISGQHPPEKLLGSADWTESFFEFEVEGGEGDVEERELVCELRGAKGSAWFDAESLILERQEDGKGGGQDG